MPPVNWHTEGSLFRRVAAYSLLLGFCLVNPHANALDASACRGGLQTGWGCVRGGTSFEHRSPVQKDIEPETTHPSERKIELDLAVLDSDGLRGPPDGKVAVSYEFSIPNTDACRAEVKAIDRTVQFMAGSRGRIGAGEGECLCIGSTHQERFREVLHALAELPYIERIIECHFE